MNARRRVRGNLAAHVDDGRPAVSAVRSRRVCVQAGDALDLGAMNLVELLKIAENGFRCVHGVTRS